MNATGGLTLGAYAAAGPLGVDGEARWFELLGAIPGAHGLEVPFRPESWSAERDRLLRRLPEGWHVVLTLLPQTVGRGGDDAGYGLASEDPGGRRRALDDLRLLHAAARDLADPLGRSAVRAVHLASAPSRRSAASSGSALAASLGDAVGLGWGEIDVILEHCDAAGTGHPAQKGYLPLGDEIEAVRAAGGRAAGLGQSVNWGRSVIEGRSAETPLDHLRVLASAGTLAGFVFSGAAGSDGPFGAAWHDVHNPVADVDPASLLDAAAISAAVAALPDLEELCFVGVKVKATPGATDPESRVVSLAATVAAIRSALVPVQASRT